MVFRAGSGHHGASGDRRDLRRGGRIDHDHRPVRDDASLGEAGHTHEVVELLAVQVQPRRPVEQAAGGRLHPAQCAQGGAPGRAEPAVATPRTPQRDDGVAGADPGHPLPHPLDDAGPFVPEHCGQAGGEVAVHVVQVAVAHPGSEHADGHLARPRVIEADILDGQWRTRPVQYCCPH
jgi:hypothetical protein